MKPKKQIDKGLLEFIACEGPMIYEEIKEGYTTYGPMTLHQFKAEFNKLRYKKLIIIVTENDYTGWVASRKSEPYSLGMGRTFDDDGNYEWS
jgi:hypothetical protein